MSDLQPEQPSGEAPEGTPAAHSSGLTRPTSQLAERTCPEAAEFEGWPDAPLLLRPRSLPSFCVEGLDGGRARVNSTPIAFKSALFEGRALIQLTGLPSSAPGLFQGKRRKSCITFQGRFLQPLSYDAVLTGQELLRPAKNLPGRWLLDNVLVSLARSINPSLTIGPMTAPSVLAPLLAAAQEINVSEPGAEPDLLQSPVEEDLTLVGVADKSGAPLPGAQRMKFFRAAANRKGRSFDCDHVWTFACFQHVIDLSRYQLHLFRRWDLASRLDGQPLQFMAKDRTSGSFLFALDAWHESLLPAVQEHARGLAGQEGPGMKIQ